MSDNLIQNIIGGTGTVDWGDIGGTLSDQTDLQSELDAKQSTSEKSAINGYASLNGSGKIPAAELPSFVDDVLEFADFASFPVTGETGKIYVALDTNLTFRWSGSVFIELTDTTAIWGNISGTLSSQTDLQTALGAKLEAVATDTTLTGDGTAGDPLSVVSTGGGVSDIDFVFAFDTTTQTIIDADTWEDFTFSDNGQLDGWTHTAGTSDFECPNTGKFKLSLELSISKVGGGTDGVAARALFNGVEIPGTHKGLDLPHAASTLPIEFTCIFDAVATQILKIQCAASTAGDISVKPGPDPAGADTPTGATITITRIN